MNSVDSGLYTVLHRKLYIQFEHWKIDIIQDRKLCNSTDLLILGIALSHTTVNRREVERCVEEGESEGGK
tara:strand:+ start:456 stop:665 length:210 start_codon:yes stop_codon:yes gene_type:complete